MIGDPSSEMGRRQSQSERRRSVPGSCIAEIDAHLSCDFLLTNMTTSSGPPTLR